MPNYCPLMSKNFAQILERTQGDPKLSASTHLLSISIDPEYDKPAVLHAYGVECAGNRHPFEHGKVVKVYRGNDWLPAEVIADFRALPRG
jgi:hypothetical protein